MAQRRSSHMAGRGALVILASGFGLAGLLPASAQDVIAKPQTPPQLVREEPAAAAPAATDPIPAPAARPQFDTRGWKCSAHIVPKRVM